MVFNDWTKNSCHLSSGQDLEGYAVDIMNDGSLKISQTERAVSKNPPPGTFLEIRAGDVTHLRAY